MLKRSEISAQEKRKAREEKRIQRRREREIRRELQTAKRFGYVYTNLDHGVYWGVRDIELPKPSQVRMTYI